MTVNGKLVNEFKHLQVFAIEDNNYLVIGGKFPLLYQTMPTVDDLQMLIIKPKNMLNSYEEFQLRKRGNILMKRQQFFNDHSNLIANYMQRETELLEFAEQNPQY
jgi:hypothetical protein